ncbi:MAG: hypothetical protein WCS33_00530 [Candidatus Caldatribacteriota bacterium]
MRLRVPKNGDKRVIKRFAFFPMIYDGEMRWLEMVDILQIRYEDEWIFESFV